MDGTIVTNDGLADGDTTETNTAEGIIPCINIRIDSMLWQARLRDLGCQKEELLKKDL